MAHNPRVFSPPLVFNQVIGVAELNALDVFTSESVNGDQGGTWAPATPIVFGGAGLDVTGPFSANDTTAITLNATGTLSAPAGALISVLGNVVFGVGAIGQWQAGSFLNVSAGATLTMSGTMNAGGAVSLSGTVTLGVGTILNIAAARSYTRVARSVGPFDTTIWAASGTYPDAYPFVALQATTITPGAPADSMPYMIDPPDGAVLTDVTVRVKGGSLLGGLPATLPRVELHRLDLTTGISILNGAVNDASASLAAYQAAHDLTISTFVLPNVDGTKVVYVVRVFGDTGAAGVFGLEIDAPRYSFTRSKVGEE